MKYQKGSFIVIPNRVALRECSPRAVSVFIQLCDMSDENGDCFPSRSLLSKRTSQSVDTCDRAITELTEKGLITKTQRKKPDGDNQTNIYHVNVLVFNGETQESSQEMQMGGGSMPLGGGKNDPTPSRKNTTVTVSSINSNHFTCGTDVPLVVIEDNERQKPRESRKTEKEAIFRLFSSKSEPWWHHKQQREAALRLYDSRGVSKVEEGVRLMRENFDDNYCPQASTPFEYEKKLPSLNNYKKRKGL